MKKEFSRGYITIVHVNYLQNGNTKSRVAPGHSDAPGANSCESGSGRWPVVGRIVAFVQLGKDLRVTSVETVEQPVDLGAVVRERRGGTHRTRSPRRGRAPAGAACVGAVGVTHVSPPLL